MALDLPLLWAFIIAIGVFMYVLLDGFDLGIGILFPLAPSERDRDTMMSSIAPIWDGNETWLVLGGTALFGAFPLAYSVLLPAFYLPLIVMLLGLIFRGVAFEFRFKSRSNRHWWGRAFWLGSTVATFAQGVVLGAFVLGVEVADRAYAGHALAWLSPFSIATGAALVAGYALLGSGWLVMKTAGDLQAWGRKMMQRALIIVVAFMAIVSIWTPLIHPEIAARWFTLPNFLYLAPVPTLTAVVALVLWYNVGHGGERTPFVLAMVLFLLGFLGLAISLWPNVVPPSISIWDASSPPASQIFLLVGTLILLPVVIAYNAWTYWVFRGKVQDEGYHH